MDQKHTSKAERYFHYQPIDVAPEVFLAIFIIIALLFIHRIYTTKSGKWLYILPGTALAEALGYGLRYACVVDTTLMKYVLANLFLIVSPNALALVNYKALARVVAATYNPVGQQEEGQGQPTIKTVFWLRPKFLTWFFFSSDIFAFFLQGGGGGMMASANPTTGQAICLVGLAIQLVFFGCFTFIAIYVHRNQRFHYTVMDVRTMKPVVNAKKKAMMCLFITIALLYIRSIYRVAEFAAGYDGPIARAEWAFYVFDSLVILASFVTYYALFLGDYLPNNELILSIHGTADHVSLSDMYK